MHWILRCVALSALTLAPFIAAVCVGAVFDAFVPWVARVRARTLTPLRYFLGHFRWRDEHSRDLDMWVALACFDKPGNFGCRSIKDIGVIYGEYPPPCVDTFSQ